MNKIKRLFRLYFPFSKNAIQSIMSYRLDFFMVTIGFLISVFVNYYLWNAIFRSSGKSTLAGFTLSQMIIYIFMIEVTSRLIRSNTDFIVGTEVREGNIAMNLIKPVNYKLRLLFEAAGNIIQQAVTGAIPLWIVLVLVRFFTLGETPPSIGTIGIYLISIVMSFLLMFLFNFCFGLLAFYTTSVWGMRLSKAALLGIMSGQLIPLAFFPLAVQKVLMWLPFSSMLYTPVMIYIGKINGFEALTSLGIQLLWIVIFAILSSWGWNRAIKRLTILGG